MLDKTFDPAAIESKRYAEWESRGDFASDVRSNKQPYTIMMPPPNVTGSLHIGHALNNTLQDLLTRYHRRRDRDALWQPGMDHAGIATQMVVERQLAEKGQTRHDLGREAFIDAVWQWKAESGGIIEDQTRRLGCTPDWPRGRFTMDEGLSAAVRRVFVKLHKDGLIYRDKRLVNWDPKLHTAISDLEVENRESDGHLWHLRYPLESDPNRYIIVATTRPETMLGDTAVAVHPDDERYADLIGSHVILPLVGRRLPIIADSYADPEQGSGAVKMTPAHDFNDYEVGRRHNLPMINIFDSNAHLNDEVPDAYRGMERYAAREKIVADLEAQGLLEKIEDHRHTIPYGDRSGVVIEPWLTDQWYCNAKELAKDAIAAVEDGRTKFVPENWTRTYYDWMRNIEPWCISRQLWWGHQIPAWYGPDGTIFVEETEEEAAAAATAHYGEPTDLKRDEDVLDTWFSSALWPFSTLGWPEQTPELERYYPTDVLLTAFDIIFFWVARMMMMGMYVMGDVPFRTVYMHALVRDAKGQKMSKSKGNIIDPLELVDRYGADALRFTLISMAAQGRDIKLSDDRVQGYRNFSTKLWNAARYCAMNGCHPVDDFDPTGAKLTVNRWIIGAVSEVAASSNAAVEEYRFNEAASALYQFAWGTFCDWYLEFTKPILNGQDAAAISETKATTGWVLDQILNLLNPHMPFVTEELWDKLAEEGGIQRQAALIRSPWPAYAESLRDDAASQEMDWVVRLISLIRTVRAEMNVPAGAKIGCVIKDPGAHAALMDTHRDLILRLARLEDLSVLEGDIPSGTAQAILGDATVILLLEGVIDLDQEAARLKKEVAKADGEIGKLQAKLGNENFLSRAPAEVVAEQRERLADTQAVRERLTAALERVGL